VRPAQHRQAGQDPVSVSLAENVVRAPLHPADQFDAFARLKADGLSAENIAARFGVEPNIVIRRLKLVGVSAKLLQA
jgi:ParB family chromosome partitioning protein